MRATPTARPRSRSSSVLTDETGGVLGTMQYYPYGGVRSATGEMDETEMEPARTDKLFTGQQREPQSLSALGLYNYGARFYSTLMGRFLSPDPLIAEPGDPQMLNRYSYVRNNPLMYVDPTGLTMAVVCGYGQDCSGGGIGSFEAWVKNYWRMTGRGEEADQLWEELKEEDFSELTRDEMIEKYDVFFIDAADVKEMDVCAYGPPQTLVNLFLELTSALPHGPLEVVLGFSEGGAYVHDMLAYMVSRDIPVGWMIRRVILVQPALNKMSHMRLDAADLPYTRIITVNAKKYKFGGMVTNAINVTGTEAGNKWEGANHGPMQRTAPFVMYLAFLLPTTYDVERDLRLVEALNSVNYGIENEWSVHGH